MTRTTGFLAILLLIGLAVGGFVLLAATGPGEVDDAFEEAVDGRPLRRRPASEPRLEGVGHDVAEGYASMRGTYRVFGTVQPLAEGETATIRVHELPEQGFPRWDRGPSSPVATFRVRATFDLGLDRPGRYALVADTAGGARGGATVRLDLAHRRARVQLRLHPETGTLEGRVRDAEGRPWVGRVVALGRGHGAVGQALARYARSGEDGVFTLSGLSTGRHLLGALLPRGQVWGEAASVPADEPYELVLPAFDRSLRVRVVADEDGSPVAGARLVVSARERRRTPFEMRAVTDASGVARVELPSTPWVIAVARAVGFGPERGSARRDQHGIEIRLRRTASVGGIVRSVTTKEPVEGVAVTARDLHGGRRTVETDATGRYELTGLAPGHLTMYAGRAPQGTDTQGWIVRAPQLELQPGARTTCDLLVHPTESIDGVVVFADGRPAEGARVRAHVRSVAGVRWYVDQLGTIAGDDGRFTMHGVPAYAAAGNETVELRAWLPGYPEGKPVSSDPFALAGAGADPWVPGDAFPAWGATAEGEGDDEGVKLVIPDACWLAVRVVDRDGGAPVPGADVRTTDESASVHAQADVRGRCRLGPVAPGGVGVRVYADGWALPREVETGQVFEAVAGKTVPAEVRMRRVYTMTGTLRYEDGKPADDRVFGVLVSGDDYRFSTDIGGGTFSFQGLSAGSYEVVVSDGGMEGVWGDAESGDVLARTTLRAGVQDAVITLSGTRPEDLVVTVLEPDGTPLASGKAHFFSDDFEWNVHHMWDGRPIEDGTARVAGRLHPLWLQVRPARTGKSLHAVARAGPIAPDETRCEIRLEAGRKVAGRVVGPDGKGLEGLVVRAWKDGLDERYHQHQLHDAEVRTDAEGSFVLDGLGAGGHWLVVEVPEGYAPFEAPLVNAGVTGEVLRLHALEQATLRVLAADGRPLEKAEVGLYRPPYFGDGSGVTAFTDASGVASLHGVDPKAVYWILVKPPKDEASSTFLWREGWTVKDEEVRLPAAWTVEGVVVDGAGRPASGVYVVADPGDDHEGSSTTTDEEGRFRLTQLTGEAIRIRARRPTNQATSTIVAVTPSDPPPRLVLRKHEGELRLRARPWPAAAESIDVARVVERPAASLWDPRFPRDRITVFPDGDGTVHIAGLDERVAWSGVVARGHGHGQAARFDGLAADGRIHDVHLVEPRTIHGRVKLPPHTWLTRLWVLGSGAWVQHPDLGEDGSLEIQGHPPGDWTILLVATRGRCTLVRTVRTRGATFPDVVFRVP